MTAHETAIAGVFPQPREEQWRKLVDRALKGASFETLISRAYGAVTLAPLYPRAVATAPKSLRRTPGRWSILGRVDYAPPEPANRLALDDLEGGADGLHVTFAGSQGAWSGGLADDGEAALSRVFESIRLDYGIPVVFEASPLAPRAPATMIRLLDSQHIDPAITRVAFGLDPLGLQALHGQAESPWPEAAKAFAAQARDIRGAGFVAGTVAADARVVHAAGGSETQELAFALSAAVAYLRALADNGLDVETARDMIGFRLAADADEFLCVAKFRALRRLWSRIEDACGLAPKPALVSAETAWRMMSRRDPWNNILRGTLATFSAAVGGADTVTVLPFTLPLGVPDPFARRLARDTQLVLQDESHIEAVDDPAAGAGGFEALTLALCEEAWAAFQKIESAGGLAAALAKGAFQGEVAETAGARARNIARAKEKIIGANQFPDIAEKTLDVLAPCASMSAGVIRPAGLLKTPPLTPRRLAEPFERLRDQSDAIAARTGQRPRVFLANIGPVAAFTTRANFAKNFFEAGGIEAVFGPEAETTTAIIEALRASGAKIACICSTDIVYADAAEPVALALKGAGVRVYLAGRPGDLEETMRKAGVSEFIFAGCDMYDLLQRALEAAG